MNLEEAKLHIAELKGFIKIEELKNIFLKNKIEALETVLQELINTQKENEELKIKNKIAEEDVHDLYISNEHKNKEWIHKDTLNNYISQDKIKKYKLKFIKDSKDEKTFMTQSSQINASLISFCNELLESEEI